MRMIPSNDVKQETHVFFPWEKLWRKIKQIIIVLLLFYFPNFISPFVRERNKLTQNIGQLQEVKMWFCHDYQSQVFKRLHGLARQSLHP